jgi:hypothetical protein
VALLQSKGKLTFLRVHEVGGKFGPPTDQIDVEAVLKLDTEPQRAMGFQLRDNGDRPVRQGMLDLLRDAFVNDLTVVVDYELDTGKRNGVVIRVALQK